MALPFLKQGRAHARRRVTAETRHDELLVQYLIAQHNLAVIRLVDEYLGKGRSRQQLPGGAIPFEEPGLEGVLRLDLDVFKQRTT